MLLTANLTSLLEFPRILIVCLSFQFFLLFQILNQLYCTTTWTVPFLYKFSHFEALERDFLNLFLFIWQIIVNVFNIYNLKAIKMGKILRMIWECWNVMPERFGEFYEILYEDKGWDETLGINHVLPAELTCWSWLLYTFTSSLSSERIQEPIKKIPSYSLYLLDFLRPNINEIVLNQQNSLIKVVRMDI